MVEDINFVAHESQVSVSINNILLEHSYAHLLDTV